MIHSKWPTLVSMLLKPLHMHTLLSFFTSNKHSQGDLWTIFHFIDTRLELSMNSCYRQPFPKVLLFETTLVVWESDEKS